MATPSSYSTTYSCDGNTPDAYDSIIESTQFSWSFYPKCEHGLNGTEGFVEDDLDSVQCWHYQRLLPTIGAAASFVVGGASALDVGGYSGSWSSAAWNPLECHEMQKTTGDASTLIDNTLCTDHRIVSALAFTAAASTIFQMNRCDRSGEIRHSNSSCCCYQDHFLLAGIAFGVGIGLALGNDLQSAIFEYMPWTTLLALLFHMCCKNVCPRNRRVMLTEKAVPYPWRVQKMCHRKSISYSAP